jgi:tetratricopeptide (TPR) repeat protein
MNANVLAFQRSNGILSRQDTIKGNESFKIGLVKYGTDDYEKAIEFFNKAINFDPDNWKAYKFKARSERKLKNYESAILDYNKTLELNKSDTASYKERANIKRFIKNCKAALPDYDLALTLDPKDVTMYFGRAFCRNELQYFQLSLNDYEICIRSLPENPILYQGRAFVYYNLKQPKNAIRDFTKYLQLGGKDVSTFYFISDCFILASEKNVTFADSAIHYIKKYQKSQEDARSYRVLAKAYEMKGDSLLCHKNFEKSFSIDSTSVDLFFEWGGAQINFHHYTSALKLLNHALKKETMPSSELYYRIGLANEGLKDTTNAFLYFTKAIEVDTNRVEIYRRRFDLISYHREYNKTAIKDLDNIIRLTTEANEISNLYAVRSLLNLYSNNIIQAKADIDKAIDLSPSSPYNYLQRAFLRTGLEPLQETLILSDIDKAISLNNKIPEAYLFRGLLYKIKGNLNASCENCRKASKMGTKVSSEMEYFFCNKGTPREGKEVNINFLFFPYLQGVVNNSKAKTK